MHQRSRAILVATVVIAATVAIVLTLRGPKDRASGSDHADGVDFKMTPVAAVYDAPEGATPCESAFNAFSAYVKAAKDQGKTPRLTLPDRATFLSRCGALPEQEQQCLAPRYAAKNDRTCQPILARLNEHNPLFEPPGVAPRGSQ